MEFSKDLSGFFDESVDIVNIEDLTKKVESSILQILKSSHKDERRHRFVKRAKSIQFCCPICGDSAADAGKMRGHIYLEYGVYKCYNEPTCSSGLHEFFRRFDLDNFFTHAEMMELEKLAINSRAELYSTRQSVTVTEAEEITPNLLDRQEIIDMFQAIEFKDDSYARAKIADRKIPNYKVDEYMLWSPNDQCILILNLHIKTQKVLNIIRRNMRPGHTGPKYITATYSELLAIKHKLRSAYRAPKEPIEMDVIASRSGINVEMIKKLDITSQFFNVMNVDWADDIFVFEGPIDSLFMPNSLALGGTGADISHPTFHYIFDNDVPGRKEAMKHLDNRQSVFMWKKFLYDNPEYRKHYAVKVDFNDMWKMRPFSPDLIRQYFTNNPLNKLNV